MASVEKLQTENTVVDEESTLGVKRHFTIAGRDPFEEIEWEIRDAFIPGKDKPAFEQKDVEFPKFWSQTATNIVAQKYFRGRRPRAGDERQADDRPRRRHDRAAGAVTAATSPTKTRRSRSRTS